MNLNEDVKNILLNENNKIKDETLEEYLTSLKKNDLFSILSLHMNSSKDVIGMYILKEKSKKQLIKYIEENLKDILMLFIKYMDSECINFLKSIIDTLIDNEYNITDNSIPSSFISFFKRFYLAKFEYNDGSLKCFIPKEFINTFKIILKDKKLLEENTKINKIFNYITYCTNVYGIIDYNTLYTFIQKDLFKIENEQLISTIDSYELSYENIHVYDSTDKLICNSFFQTEDMAINFYKRQKGEYKKYSLSELKNLGNSKYIQTLKSYNSFIDYLNNIFDISLEDEEYIKNYLIINYLNNSNISKETADENFKNNAKEMFDLESDEINDLKKIAKDIYEKYPKWIKKGNL